MYNTIKNQIRKLKPGHEARVWVSCGIVNAVPPKDIDQYTLHISCGLTPDSYDGGKL